MRDEGEYHGQRFKVKHLGFGDARNMDGNSYMNCDYLLFYDIETDQSNFFNFIFKKVITESSSSAAVSFSSGEIEDLEVRAYVKYGVPVLGAVKLDVSGRYRGRFVKAGADYIPNR